MQKYILLLIIVSLFFTGCFQKDASQEESGLIDIDMSEENEITSS
jgi:PBP1b-binding outer membrane lipoprotein LpoB